VTLAGEVEETALSLRFSVEFVIVGMPQRGVRFRDCSVDGDGFPYPLLRLCRRCSRRQVCVVQQGRYESAIPAYVGAYPGSRLIDFSNCRKLSIGDPQLKIAKLYDMLPASRVKRPKAAAWPRTPQCARCS
jgi:hypothetical protein